MLKLIQLASFVVFKHNFSGAFLLPNYDIECKSYHESVMKINQIGGCLLSYKKLKLRKIHVEYKNQWNYKLKKSFKSLLGFVCNYTYIFWYTKCCFIRTWPHIVHDHIFCVYQVLSYSEMVTCVLWPCHCKNYRCGLWVNCHARF